MPAVRSWSYDCRNDRFDEDANVRLSDFDNSFNISHREDRTTTMISTTITSGTISLKDIPSIFMGRFDLSGMSLEFHRSKQNDSITRQQIDIKFERESDRRSFRNWLIEEPVSIYYLAPLNENFESTIHIYSIEHVVRPRERSTAQEGAAEAQPSKRARIATTPPSAVDDTVARASYTRGGLTTITSSSSISPSQQTTTNDLSILDAQAKTKDTRAEVVDTLRHLQRVLHTAIVDQHKSRTRALEEARLTDLAQEEEQEKKKKKKKKIEALTEQERVLREQVQAFQRNQANEQARITELQERVETQEIQMQEVRRDERILQDLLRHVLNPVLGGHVDVKACVDLVRAGQSFEQAIVESNATVASCVEKKQESSVSNE